MLARASCMSFSSLVFSICLSNSVFSFMISSRVACIDKYSCSTIDIRCLVSSIFLFMI
ncbi:hypothetical protein O6H91_22G004300 [Diphasiastrum complanatum]|uniref:Uncharacterized protein n=1 Tax=Diphasiastrum complanatum TaxID=34168 RepID=A0ACC2ACE1_DIPCM|nr:hypothetical protein O6H91_22G004300 [Diphasiastrum complanatum]